MNYQVNSETVETETSLSDLGRCIAKSVEAVHQVEEPISYYYMSRILPENLYSSLVENLPPDRYYRDYRHGDATLPNGRSARLKLDLFPETLVTLPHRLREFWTEVSRQVRSQELTETIKLKFAKELERVSGKPLSQIKIHPYPVLFRDIAGYKISIHPDSPRKAITSQYYLPEGDSQTHLGTLFHRKNEQGEFETLRQLDFAPNSGYAFAVSERSWHSVNVIDGGDRPRNSLMLIYYHDRGPILESLRYVQRKLGIIRALKPSDARHEGRIES